MIRSGNILVDHERLKRLTHRATCVSCSNPRGQMAKAQKAMEEEFFKEFPHMRPQPQPLATVTTFPQAPDGDNHLAGPPDGDEPHGV